jgi:nucleotide-binding universal stress UspA family protein
VNPGRTLLNVVAIRAERPWGQGKVVRILPSPATTVENREDPQMRTKTIVVGYDGSEMAGLALEAAARLAEEDSVVHVVTAAQPFDDRTQRQLAAVPEEFRINIDPYAHAEALLEEAAARLGSAGISTETHLALGDPAGAILDTAAKTDADLIVVGSRGLGKVSRFLRGSVSSKVMTHAPHSVLVVHDGE